MLETVLSSKILIVDDEWRNVHLLARLLKEAGFINVYSTTDSRQALALYREVRPDLVLLDVLMPFLDGFAVMKQLFGESDPNEYLPILMLTADITSETKQKALSSGAKDFLTKPLDLSEVILRVRNLLETRLLHIRVREQNEELERKVQERTRQLAESRMEILDRLALAGEYRDQDTAEHTRRVGNLAAALASASGSSSEFVELIRHAAQLHDIGKIGVPDHILRKIGALDTHEFDIMKDHARIGSRILSGSSDSLLNMAQSIALTHHEWWDGSGYPTGLSGGSIPFEGRVVALADAVDALTSERAYKKAWPLDATILQLEKQSGKQFDPDLTRAMVGLLKDSGLVALAQATVSGVASAEAPVAGAVGVVGEELIR